MSFCNLCPRKCNIDRNIQNGFCSVGDELLVARAALHFWEEPCISGKDGSGAVFFSGCNLKCVYCQNKLISRGKVGKNISVERLSEIFIELQEQGANNINLVTPDHYADKIISAIDIARNNGLKLPIVYNTSCYCDVEIIKKLDGYIDIYLPDFKYFDNKLGKKYSSVNNYCEISKTALEEMFKQCHNSKYKNGIMQKGIIVRHLVLPGFIDNSKDCIKYLYDKYGDEIVISLMSQYLPMDLTDYPELNRTVTKEEYNEIVDFAVDLGITNAFVQEGSSADESFIPDFYNCEGV